MAERATHSDLRDEFPDYSASGTSYLPVPDNVVEVHFESDQKLASFAFERLTEKISTKLPPGLRELGELGRTLKRGETMF